MMAATAASMHWPSPNRPAEKTSVMNAPSWATASFARDSATSASAWPSSRSLLLPTAIWPFRSSSRSIASV